LTLAAQRSMTAVGPPRVAQLLVRLAGCVLGWVAGSVLRIRRHHVEASMRMAGVMRPREQARRMYRALGMSAIEFLWLASSGRRALAHVRIDQGSVAPWRQALSHGRGVVVAASHTGNWDLAACAVAHDVELLVVTKHLRIRWLDRFWQATRAAQGVTLAAARGAMRRGREVLGRGGAVAMMIDQVPESARHAVPVEFLGGIALVDRAPAALAASARAPLVVAASARGPRGEHLLHVLDVLVPPARPSRAWVDRASALATQALQRFVLENPSQWLWLHRRWKALDRSRAGGACSRHAARAAMLGAPCTTRSSSPAGPSRAA
jgi:KDO2-lipid IV(A) lauroyltransferase